MADDNQRPGAGVVGGVAAGAESRARRSRQTEWVAGRATAELEELALIIESELARRASNIRTLAGRR